MTVSAAPAIADPSRFISDLRSRRHDGVLCELVDAAVSAGAVRARQALLEILKLRDRVLPSAVVRDAVLIGARSLAVTRPFLAVGRSERGVAWGGPASDAEPVHLVVLALAPAEWSEDLFHAFLGRAGALVRLQRQRQRLVAAGSEQLLAALMREVGA